MRLLMPASGPRLPASGVRLPASGVTASPPLPPRRHLTAAAAARHARVQAPFPAMSALLPGGPLPAAPVPTRMLFGLLRDGPLAAAANGGAAAVRRALAAGADATDTWRFPTHWKGGTWPAYPGYHDFEAEEEEEEQFTAKTDVSMLGAAAIGNCAAAVPLLLEAGAQVTLLDVNQAIWAGSTEALAALLAAAQPRAPGGSGMLRWAEPECACPLWTVMRWAYKTACGAAPAWLSSCWRLAMSHSLMRRRMTATESASIL